MPIKIEHKLKHIYFQVSDAAMRLNRVVVESLLKFGIPAVSVSAMSAATTSRNGQITSSSKKKTFFSRSFILKKSGKVSIL
jgi:isopentenyl phosphate kinase